MNNPPKNEQEQEDKVWISIVNKERDMEEAIIVFMNEWTYQVGYNG